MINKQLIYYLQQISDRQYLNKYLVYFHNQMLNKVILILIFIIFPINGFLDYSFEHTLQCQSVNTTENLSELLPSLWNITILHDFDRIFFLVACPIIIIFQAFLLVTVLDNLQLLEKPGDIFFGMLISQFILNVHCFATAIYYSIYSTSNPMPSSFVVFCQVNSFLSSFCTTLQIQYGFLFLTYIVTTVKTSLKQRTYFFKYVIHPLILVLSIGCSTFFYFDNFLGLGNQGLCQITSIRKGFASIALPICSIVLSLLFIGVGLYSWSYFHKHMPKTKSLRRRRYQQSKLISIYVGGLSILVTCSSIVNLIVYINCFSNSPAPLVTICSSIDNIIKIIQYTFLLILLFRSNRLRKKIKKMIRRLFQRQSSKNKDIQMSHFFQTDLADIGLDQNILQLRQQENIIDMLKVAQIITILSGIYVAHKQYLKNFDFQEHQIKKIYFCETITFQIGQKIMNDYQIQTQILPKVGILDGNITIHAPRVFKKLLNLDNLTDVHQSFDLFKNYQKMYNLVQGSGGKSGEFFFFSSDNKYVLKTIGLDQYRFIIDHLENFVQYFLTNPQSLIAKIYGVYTISSDQVERSYNLILMKNIIGCSRQKILRTYDMKGSKYDRQVIKSKTKYKYNQLSKMTLKDTDFIKLQGKLYIDHSLIPGFRNMLRKDSQFLKSMNLIDYSLLVVRIQENQVHQPIKLEEKNQIPSDFINYDQLRQLKEQKKKQELDNFHKYQRMQSIQNANQYYHIGVIDYMQRWDLQKKGQKWWKTFIGKKQVSAEQPKKYQKRFMGFVDQITMHNRISDLADSSKTSYSGKQSQI